MNTKLDFKSKLTGMKISTRQTRGRSHWEQLSEIPETGVIAVSLSNQNCIGNRLLTIVEWAKQYFPNIQFHLTDTLYRHNYKIQFSLSEKEATEKAEKEGEIWIENNKEILTTDSVVRWHKWLEHPSFRKPPNTK